MTPIVMMLAVGKMASKVKTSKVKTKVKSHMLLEPWRNLEQQPPRRKVFFLRPKKKPKRLPSSMPAEELDKRLSETYGSCKNKNKEGRGDLWALKKEEDYNTDSSEAQ